MSNEEKMRAALDRVGWSRGDKESICNALKGWRPPAEASDDVEALRERVEALGASVRVARAARRALAKDVCRVGDRGSDLEARVKNLEKWIGDA